MPNIALAATGRGPQAETRLDEVRLHRALGSVEPIWCELQDDAVMTPYQTWGLLSAWLRHLAPARRVEPLVVTGHDATGRAILLVPLGTRDRSGVRIAEYLGGSHANYNMPIFRRAAFEAIGPDALCLVKRALRSGGVDLLALRRQPEAWEGRPNPFLPETRQASPDFAYSGALDRPYEALYQARVSSNARAKDRKKLRHLEKAGPVRFFRASTPEERGAVLRAFLVQRAERFAAQGIRNVFDEPGTRGFLEEACASVCGDPAIDLYALTVGEHILATLGVTAHGGRVSAMFTAIANCPLERESPGVALMQAMVADAIARGCTSVDFGVGAADYKMRFCDRTDRLFDSFIGLSPVGRVAAAAIAVNSSAKRAIKSSDWLWGVVESARRNRAAGRSEDEDGETAVGK